MGGVPPAVFGIRTHNLQGFSPDLAIHRNRPWHFWFSSGDYAFFRLAKYLKIPKQKTVSVFGTNLVLYRKKDYIAFFSVLVLCTQVNMMFVMLL